jgi:hypothetical protein
MDTASFARGVARPAANASSGEECARAPAAAGATGPRPAGDGVAVRALAESDEDGTIPSRIDWATLLRRIYDVDALACPCGGRLELLELVTDATEIREVLDRLGLDDEPPETAGDSRIRGP